MQMLYRTNAFEQGFTLLELVVVLAIAAILAVLTVPDYRDSVRAARRGDAKAELLRLAQNQAKWRLTHLSYANLEELGGATPSLDYTFAVIEHNASTFAIAASPTGSRGQADDLCGILTINQDVLLSSNNSACVKP